MIKDLIALDDSARIWIYPANEEFSYEELDEVRPIIHQFLMSWTSHNQALVTYGNVFHRRFLALFVDESVSGASGCSIDKSVHFIQEIGTRFNKDLFNRQSVQFLINEEVVVHPLNEISALYSKGDLNENTLFFNNLVKTKAEFLQNWIQPISQSWLKRFL